MAHTETSTPQLLLPLPVTKAENRSGQKTTRKREEMEQHPSAAYAPDATAPATTKTTTKNKKQKTSSDTVDDEDGWLTDNDVNSYAKLLASLANGILAEEEEEEEEEKEEEEENGGATATANDPHARPRNPPTITRHDRCRNVLSLAVRPFLAAMLDILRKERAAARMCGDGDVDGDGDGGGGGTGMSSESAKTALRKLGIKNGSRDHAAEFVDSDLIAIPINQDKHWSVLIGFGRVLGGGGDEGADNNRSTSAAAASRGTLTFYHFDSSVNSLFGDMFDTHREVGRRLVNSLDLCLRSAWVEHPMGPVIGSVRYASARPPGDSVRGRLFQTDDWSCGYYTILSIAGSIRMLLASAGAGAGGGAKEGKGASAAASVQTLRASMNERVHEVFAKAMRSNVVALRGKMELIDDAGHDDIDEDEEDLHLQATSEQ